MAGDGSRPSRLSSDNLMLEGEMRKHWNHGANSSCALEARPALNSASLARFTPISINTERPRLPQDTSPASSSPSAARRLHPAANCAIFRRRAQRRGRLGVRTDHAAADGSDGPLAEGGRWRPA